MRGTRTDRSNKYAPVPQAVSDEDEGVYEESPESSQQMELVSTEFSTDGKSVAFADDFQQQNLQTLDFCSRGSHRESHTPHPIAFIEAQSPNKNSKMSPSRQVCFLISLSVCMAYMVSLLWLIPCHMAPCIVKNSHRTLPLQLKEWNNTFPHLRTEQKSKEVVAGVIALRGEDGKEIWRFPFYTNVLDVACHTDVNNDGIIDCAILGSTGLLATINASNGHTFWYLHDHDDRSAQISAISRPCVLTETDFDRDGVDDFVTTGVMTYDGFRNIAEATPVPSWQIYDEQVAHVGLLLVSGSNGQIIGQPLLLPNMLAPGSSIGYRKIPNLVVYSLGNSTKSLLLLLGSGDGSRINQQNNPETVLMISIEDLYAGATHDRKAEDSYYAEFRNVYSAKGSIQSITVMENDQSKGGDILLLTNNDEELICLDGANDLRLKWKYSKEKSKISKPVLGKFNMDGILDIFIILMPFNCASCDCKSEITVLNGKDGQEITHAFVNSMAFNPIVLYSNTINTTDKFIFKNAILSNESEGQESKHADEKVIANNDEDLNKNQSALLPPVYTNMSEQEIHNDAADKNPDLLAQGKIRDHDVITSALLCNVLLMEFLRDRELSTWEIDLPPINCCQGLNTEDDNDIIIEEPQFGSAYLIVTGEFKGASKINLIDLNARSSASSCNKVAGTALHPTIE